MPVQVFQKSCNCPFGMLMPGRSNVTGNQYKYGFNGKENDNEVKGEGNQQDYGKRIYDSRLGRFFSIDPITGSFPMLTPYQFASNTPIMAIDLDGLESFIVVNTFVNNSRVKTTIYATKNLETGKYINYAFQYINKKPVVPGYADVVVFNDGLDDHPSFQKALNPEQSRILKNGKQTPLEGDQHTASIGGHPEILISKFLGDNLADLEGSKTYTNNFQMKAGGIALGVTNWLKGSVYGDVPNGYIDWKTESNASIKNLVASLKQEGNVQAVSVTATFNISNATDAEYENFKSGVANAEYQMKKEFEKSGAKNVNVKFEATRDAVKGSEKIDIQVQR